MKCAVGGKINKIRALRFILRPSFITSSERELKSKLRRSEKSKGRFIGNL